MEIRFQKFPTWILSVSLGVIACFFAYAIIDNRQIDFWPPRILPHPNEPETPVELPNDQNTPVLDYLAGIGDSEVAVLEVLSNRDDGEMLGSALRDAIQTRGVFINEGHLTGMRSAGLVEGNFNSLMSLTPLGIQAAGTVRNILAIEALGE